MRVLFWLGLTLLLLFEFFAVYFIMPMPGSQEAVTLPAAYFLYSYRWWFRIGAALLLAQGLYYGGFKRRWLALGVLAPAAALVYLLNFKMAADRMFSQVKTLVMMPATQNIVDGNRLVIGVALGNRAKAYPIRFLGYHHLVADSVNGQPVLVTYCTVCRTGRVYSPLVNGSPQQFRLVGMDHYNAMIEDAATKSWWQQATGEAVAGPLKGHRLAEVFSTQTTLAEWLKMNPHSLVMQPDPGFTARYDTTLAYEEGSSRKALTGTDTISWKNKSWVVGLENMGSARAYDWNLLKAQRLVQDTLGGQPMMLVLAMDGKSFYAFRGMQVSAPFRLMGDTLYNGQHRYLVNGKPLGNGPALSPAPAYQEFWHSWRSFRPGTGVYEGRR